MRVQRYGRIGLLLGVGLSLFGLMYVTHKTFRTLSRIRSDEPASIIRHETPPRDLAAGFQRAPYLQSLGMDSVLVAWIASAPGTPAVDYGTSPRYGFTALATSDGARRVATLRHLQPGTTYLYRVRAGKRVLASGSGCFFQTDPGPKAQDFSFFVTGDIGEAGGKQRVTEQSILRATPRPEFGLICGDVMYETGSSHDYEGHLMRPWQELLSRMPIWPALGNHDWLSPPETNWCKEWYLPNNEHYYSFDYGNAHFIALDNAKGQLYQPNEQLAWLENDLRTHAHADWLFVFYHYPGITCSYKENNPAVIQRLMPLFDQYHVDVVFNGHAHTYERLYPIKDRKPVDRGQYHNYVDPGGTIYIVTGCGAKVKTGEPTRRCGPTAFFKDETILWTRVRIQGGRCTIQSYTSATDELVDTATISKRRLAVTALSSPMISADSAQAIARAYLPHSRVLSGEIEEENGQVIYSIHLELPEKAGVEEVNIGAKSGEIVGVEHEPHSNDEKPASKPASAQKH